MPEPLEPERVKAEILTIAASVVFGRSATSRTDNSTWACSLSLGSSQCGQPTQKSWNPRWVSTRRFEKCLSLAISTFASDPDLNPPNEQRSSGWALSTITTPLYFSLHMPSPCTPFGPLCFPKLKIPDAIMATCVHRTSSLVVG